MSQGGATGVDLWLSDAPARGLNGSYGDLVYASRALGLIQQHAQMYADEPLYLNLALQV